MNNSEQDPTPSDILIPQSAVQLYRRQLFRRQKWLIKKSPSSYLYRLHSDRNGLPMLKLGNEPDSFIPADTSVEKLYHLLLESNVHEWLESSRAEVHIGKIHDIQVELQNRPLTTHIEWEKAIEASNTAWEYRDKRTDRRIMRVACQFLHIFMQCRRTCVQELCVLHKINNPLLSYSPPLSETARILGRLSGTSLPIDRTTNHRICDDEEHRIFADAQNDIEFLSVLDGKSDMTNSMLDNMAYKRIGTAKKIWSVQKNLELLNTLDQML
ncbi:unnamed protein product [Fusarium venenatum]|uniref:Uncharacterized protein n=2 Tax=Fusarium venenatum TaxID=56646 RepID=A0A2L2TU79_9HYPO|nr:uncharacterized protein FVRRES_00257 [Fusarium venenatum]CEI63745.1 unnamed protein product [Fusarium venenatum]